MDSSQSGFSDHWISQARMARSGLPFSPQGDLSDPEIEPVSPTLASRFFTTEPPGKPSIIMDYN